MSSSKTGKLRIATAQDLFEALGSEQLGVRLAVLSAISKSPEKAASYGPHEGRDLVEELTDQLAQTGDTTLRRALSATLAAFNDPRATAGLKEAFLASHDTQEILLCAQRLAAEPSPETKELFLASLRSNAQPLQARAAANVMAEAEDRKPGDRVRIAILCDVAYETPTLDKDNTGAWLEELTGPHRERARALLKSQGQQTWVGLREAWDSLPQEAMAWLLDWGCRDYPDLADELCLTALAQGPDDLHLAALQAASLLPALSDKLHGAVTPFLGSIDSELRLAAVRAADSVSGVREAMSKETDPRILIALTPHLVRAHGEEASPDLAILLESNDWRVRGAAAQALKGLGEAGQQAVERLRDHPKMEVRAAVAQVLEVNGGSS